MKNQTTKRMHACSLIAGVVLLGSLLAAVPASAQTTPVATPPYKVRVFAQSSIGVSQPDSIVRWHDSIIAGFQNHVAKDGTDGKSSTIVEFSLDGKVKRTFTVPGHNDGLRVIGDSDLWSSSFPEREARTSAGKSLLPIASKIRVRSRDVDFAVFEDYIVIAATVRSRRKLVLLRFAGAQINHH